jgi:AraC-like DNA-binding protein
VFKPGGAGPFFELPLTEIRNQRIPLDALWGNAAGDMREQLLAAATPQDCFQALERILTEKLYAEFDTTRKKHAFIRHAVGHLWHSPGDHCLERIRVESGYASTRFINLFSHSVGLTPKQFFRVQRFQRVLHTLFRSGDADWSDLALQFGYYDQAHFIHEFKAFTGITPGNYFSKRIEEQNHLAF